MRRYTIIGLAALGLAACGTGCQSSGSAETTTTTNRPVVVESKTYSTAAIDTSAYTTAYMTKAEIPYMNLTTDTTPAGTLMKGDTVYLRGTAPSTGMVAAKTADGRIVFVRSVDLLAK